MSALPIHRVSLDAITGWGGEAYWVYDHIMAVRPGALLLVPTHLVDGSLKGVCALCPVPYQGVLTVLDQERSLVYRDVLELRLGSQAGWPIVQEIAGPGYWFAAAVPNFKATVYRHEFGTRLAIANELRITQTVREA